MAILTEQQDNALELFSKSDAQGFAVFVGGLNQKFGPSNDFEFLIQSFQIQAPDRWLSFITALVANYTATNAEVEQEIGKKSLAGLATRREGPAYESTSASRCPDRLSAAQRRISQLEGALNSELAKNASAGDASDIQLDAARAEGREAAVQAGRAQDLINRRVIEIGKMLRVECNQDENCDILKRTLRKEQKLSQIVEGYIRGTRYQDDYQVISDVVARARMLDGNTDFLPSSSALELVFENLIS